MLKQWLILGCQILAGLLIFQLRWHLGPLIYSCTFSVFPSEQPQLLKYWSPRITQYNAPREETSPHRLSGGNTLTYLYMHVKNSTRTLYFHKYWKRMLVVCMPSSMFFPFCLNKHSNILKRSIYHAGCVVLGNAFTSLEDSPVFSCMSSTALEWERFSGQINVE